MYDLSRFTYNTDGGLGFKKIICSILNIKFKLKIVLAYTNKLAPKEGGEVCVEKMGITFFTNVAIQSLCGLWKTKL